MTSGWLRSAISHLWRRLDLRDRVVVGAGLGILVATLLPWLNLSLPSASRTFNAWNNPNAPVTLIPAIVALAVAASALSRIFGWPSAGRPRGQHVTPKARWWPPIEPSKDEPPSIAGDPPLIPPPIWREPILVAWALLMLICFLFVNTSASVKGIGFWITLFLVIVLAFFILAESAPAPRKPGPSAPDGSAVMPTRFVAPPPPPPLDSGSEKPPP